MSSTEVPTLYDCCRAGIAELLEANPDMSVIERTIDAYALDRREKDALRLWSVRRRRLGSLEPNDTAADESRRLPLSSRRKRGFAGGNSDELAALRGKNLGACAACGRPVFFAQDFTRSLGHIAHVRCPVTAQMPSPLLPALPARFVRRVRSEPA